MADRYDEYPSASPRQTLHGHKKSCQNRSRIRVSPHHTSSHPPSPKSSCRLNRYRRCNPVLASVSLYLQCSGILFWCRSKAMPFAALDSTHARICLQSGVSGCLDPYPTLGRNLAYRQYPIFQRASGSSRATWVPHRL
ncbi:Uncharacterised protein [Vibrio cholerae]|uniref:Uncharacterized protein n=1 Tax=Vibrio cholerae TaxID=666 RepID=A0A655YJT6_VIBCL|nr:Uncharacterised protein [Vibrio cholerae]CRZ64033.1 Uncharacterised protein [Vibrio cholerae]CRZ94438.1 Uncharacterised protein [Vibrio cholerae]CSA12393.1 Uncharacterised protein [Vibrio cholerae]CSA55581.1 Uncharacterised protein [Vibrio cholerae]